MCFLFNIRPSLGMYVVFSLGTTHQYSHNSDATVTLERTSAVIVQSGVGMSNDIVHVATEL